jgi:hypothetical protein
MPFSAKLAGTKRRAGNIIEQQGWQRALQQWLASDETNGALQ